MEYIIFTESPSVGSMSFNPSIPIIDTNDIRAYIQTIETRHGTHYRYYPTPGIYQREKGYNQVESIMTLDRFARNWYLQYPKMELEIKDVVDEVLLTDLKRIASDLFVNIYPVVVKVLKDNYCSIRSIDLRRDDIGITDIIIEFSDKEGKNGSVNVYRKER